MQMQPQDPEFQKRAREIFAKDPFISELGIQLKEIAAGQCVTELVVHRKHLQQDQIVHAGVQAAMADHTAGGAAGSLMAENQIVLTIEFKINLLRPAKADRLICRSQVIKPGRRICVAESEVFADEEISSKLVSKATVTLVFVPDNSLKVNQRNK